MSSELHRQLNIPIGDVKGWENSTRLLNEIVAHLSNLIKNMPDEKIEKLRQECSVSPSDHRFVGTLFSESFHSVIMHLVNIVKYNKVIKDNSNNVEK